MNRTRRTAASLLAASAALLTLELLAVLAALPHARGALRNPQARALVRAGTAAWNGVISASTSRLAGIGADLAMHSVRQASGTYAAMLRLGPRGADAGELSTSVRADIARVAGCAAEAARIAECEAARTAERGGEAARIAECEAARIAESAAEAARIAKRGAAAARTAERAAEAARIAECEAARIAEFEAGVNSCSGKTVRTVPGTTGRDHRSLLWSRVLMAS